MNYLDVYYRALLDYRKNTSADRDCTNQRGAVAKANAKTDEIKVTRKICNIETDWIDAISEGLVHVEKAIKEERQFIRSNGEVIDIEKVKNVSKDSVEHLARHSNLITRYEEGEEIVPDRLYTVERLSDYAVYENRFLYMMLCYLRDFITVRYNKIIDLEHTYNGEMTMNKSIAMPKRNIDIKIELKEERKDDEFLKKRSTLSDLIVRIRDNLELVHSFLNTPLMQEVAKVPMLKPPVTKTNVLRMNHNFRGALALYEYVSAYDKDGYSVSEEVQRTSPLRLDTADELSEVVLLASFLAYEHGLNIKDELKASYDIEEERRHMEELRRHEEQLKAMRRRSTESAENAEEYMLMLEKRNRELEKETENMFRTREENEELKVQLLNINNERKSLLEQILNLNNKIDDINASHRSEIDSLNNEHRENMDALRKEEEERVEAARAEYEDAKKQIEGKVAEAQSECQARINETEARALEHKTQADMLVKNKEAQYKNLESAYEKILEARRISDARLIALRNESGLIHPYDDFTSESAFVELEYELDALKRFVKEQWKGAKKTIRKNAFADLRQEISAHRAAKKTSKSADISEEDSFYAQQRDMMDIPEGGDSDEQISYYDDTDDRG